MPEYTADRERTLSTFVGQNFRGCASYLVSALAEGYGSSLGTDTLVLLAEQAFELSTPVRDPDEALYQNGHKVIEIARDDGPTEYAVVPLDYEGTPTADDVTLYEDDDEARDAWLDESRIDVEDYGREVFEHWIIDPWLGRKLEARGEKVDRDFAGLCVWGRTTTGQAISMDEVIGDIYDALHAPALAA